METIKEIMQNEQLFFSEIHSVRYISLVFYIFLGWIYVY